MSFVKSNLTKHMSSKFFYAHELYKMNEIKVLHTKSCENSQTCSQNPFMYPLLKDEPKDLE
jgi:hypothetical protein